MEAPRIALAGALSLGGASHCACEDALPWSRLSSRLRGRSPLEAPCIALAGALSLGGSSHRACGGALPWRRFALCLRGRSPLELPRIALARTLSLGGSSHRACEGGLPWRRLALRLRVRSPLEAPRMALAMALSVEAPRSALGNVVFLGFTWFCVFGCAPPFTHLAASMQECCSWRCLTMRMQWCSPLKAPLNALEGMHPGAPNSETFLVSHPKTF